MTSDARLPVLVGCGQITVRDDDKRFGTEPALLMAESLRLAAEDAGNPKLLEAADTIAVPKGIWPYADPGRIVSQEVGAPTAKTILSPIGGNYCQTLVSDAASAIQAGERDIVLFTAAETQRSQRKARNSGKDISYTPSSAPPDIPFPDSAPEMSHPREAAIGLFAPTTWYALFEIGLRYKRGEKPDEHIKRVSELWERFAAVAADNPYAMIRDHPSATEIRTPSPTNRMISFPYTKLMTANINVDQTASAIVCSVETARRMGVPEDRWVYIHSGADAHDHTIVSHRESVCGSPAMRIAGNRALELANITKDDIDHIDVYSCFPCAVQILASELDIPETRRLTVTGGLTFFGGPLNSYVAHGITSMMDTVRADPGSKGLVTANGGFTTKHAFGVYSTEPPADGFKYENVQEEVDKTPRRVFEPDHVGDMDVEAYTVVYGREGFDRGIVSGITAEGSRSYAVTTDTDLMTALTEEEFCGRTAQRAADGTVKF